MNFSAKCVVISKATEVEYKTYKNYIKQRMGEKVCVRLCACVEKKATKIKYKWGSLFDFITGHYGRDKL